MQRTSGAAVLEASEVGGVRQCITAYSQNLREYECSMQTSGIHGTLSKIIIIEAPSFQPDEGVVA